MAIFERVIGVDGGALRLVVRGERQSRPSSTNGRSQKNRDYPYAAEATGILNWWRRFDRL
jgi:hypothetical protein